MNEREANDYYATEPKAVELLMDLETFSNQIYECACGEGHISEILKRHGYEVSSTDLIYRGYGEGGVDFLECKPNSIDADIVTNPPYSKAIEFVETAIEAITEGHKVAMFLKLTFLETQKRKELFKKYPPKIIYISSSRLVCAKNGDFTNASAAVAYAWYIWEKGYKGQTTVEWFN